MAENKKNSNYTAKNLKILKGLDPVRKRPGMYIGSTDWRGTHHLVWEIVDNAIDEAMAGFGKKIIITIHKDGSLSVLDEGRGIPCDYNEKEKMDGLDIVFCTLHGGGKFTGDVYKSAAGLHGVGAACANALSKWLEVTVYKDGKEYHCRYENGGTNKIGTDVVGTTSKHGSLVRFLPSDKVLSEVDFRFDLIADHLNNSACQCPKVRFVLIDERDDNKQEFYYDKGISEYLEKKNEGMAKLHPVVYYADENSEIKAEFCFQFLKDNYDERIFSFANSVFTTLEGSHVRGLRSGITKAFNDYASQNGIITGKEKLDGADIREGLSVVVSVRIPEDKIQFEGQTKEKLGTPDAAIVVENLVYEKLYYYLIENKDVAKKIINKILDAKKAREAARSARDDVRNKIKPNNEKTTLLLSGKLVPPQSKEYNKCELFIVEGDSAGGSAKKCRDRKYQGLLPLRGKPKNINGESDANIMKNEELSTLTYTIGTGMGKDFNIRDLRYGKIIIMTDADTDGSHIQNLLINFFYLKMKPLIEKGHIYIACPPLYRVSKMVGKKTLEEFCWSDSDVLDAKKKLGANCEVSRFKGLGEMDADQLWKTTMDPTTRKLIKLTMPDEQETGELVEKFMGKDAEPRAKWIDENIDFTDKSDFLSLKGGN